MTVEAVIALAAEQAPTDITTDAIAKRMGVTQGALFRHFSSKDAILQAVMEWVSERLLAQIDEATATAAFPLEAIEAAFMAHVHFIAAHPGAPRILFDECQRTEQTMSKHMARTFIQIYGDRLGRFFLDGKRLGQLPASLDERAAATLFIGMVQGLAMQSHMEGDVKRIRKYAPAVLALYFRSFEAAK